MKLVTRDLLAQLSADAGATPRLRKNHNLHASNDSICHRLLNALEPGTYIRPHCHLDPEKAETMLLLEGRIGLLCFSGQGQVEDAIVLSRESGILAVDIPAGVFHSVVSLTSGSVFFEAKAGPYLPLTAQESAAWAPAEGEGHLAYLEEMLRHFPH